MDEVGDGLDHAELDVVVDAAHQPKIQDGQPPVRRADQIARVRVRLQVNNDQVESQVLSIHERVSVSLDGPTVARRAD